MPTTCFDKHIFRCQIERDGPITRNRPRGGSPNYYFCALKTLDELSLGDERIVGIQGRSVAIACNRPKVPEAILTDGVFGDLDDWEPYIHRVAGMLLVFDLRLGERRLFDDAPHHRLGSAIEQAIGDELEDLAGDLRLGGIAHRQIGMLPIADDAEPLELLALHVDPVLGIGAALAAEGDDRLRVGEVGLGLALLAIMLLLDAPLDRQAMAIPAGHVIGILARHLMRADDNVLQDLIEGVADVDVAVGVGRAVVQHELRAPLAGFAQRRIEAFARPARQNLGLLLRQPRAHGKVGLRQEQGLRIVGS